MVAHFTRRRRERRASIKLEALAVRRSAAEQGWGGGAVYNCSVTAGSWVMLG